MLKIGVAESRDTSEFWLAELIGTLTSSRYPKIKAWLCISLDKQVQQWMLKGLLKLIIINWR
jgi:hypothetical protein